MSKTITAGMDNHLQGEVTSLAACWAITRTDGTVFRFTDHDKDIEFPVASGNIYRADTGYQRTAIENDATLAVDNLDIIGILDSTEITDVDLRAGKFDFAQVQIFLVNWQDLTDGDIKLRNGRLGEVILTEQGTYRAELRGLSQLLSQRVGEVYQAECRADLGDSRCKVPIDPDVRQDSTVYTLGTFIRVATTTGTGQEVYENRIYECTQAGTTAASQPSYDTTVNNTTTDGTAVFTARQAWMRHGVVDTVSSNTQFTLTVAFDETRAVDNWFNGGAIEFEDGNNQGVVIEIRDWTQSTREVTIFLPAPFTVTSGDRVRLYPGCDKRDQTCINKFDIPLSVNFANGNIFNFRGEPFVPGQDVLTRYPDAKSA